MKDLVPCGEYQGWKYKGFIGRDTTFISVGILA